MNTGHLCAKDDMEQGKQMGFMIENRSELF